VPIGVLVSSLHEVGPQKGAFSSRESRGFEFDLSLLTAGREPSRPTRVRSRSLLRATSGGWAWYLATSAPHSEANPGFLSGVGARW